MAVFSSQGPHEVFNITLPADWTIYWDAERGLPYFHNAREHRVQWRCPTIDGCAAVNNDVCPDPLLLGAYERLMQSRRFTPSAHSAPMVFVIIRQANPDEF